MNQHKLRSSHTSDVHFSPCAAQTSDNNNICIISGGTGAWQGTYNSRYDNSENILYSGCCTRDGNWLCVLCMCVGCVHGGMYDDFQGQVGPSQCAVVLLVCRLQILPCMPDDSCDHTFPKPSGSE